MKIKSQVFCLYISLKSEKTVQAASEKDSEKDKRNSYFLKQNKRDSF